MSRWIDADALKETVRDKLRLVCDCVCKLIDDAPTVEPKEPKKGKWIEVKENYLLGTGTRYFCSECDSCGHCIKTNFCPNCGADMR